MKNKKTLIKILEILMILANLIPVLVVFVGINILGNNDCGTEVKPCKISYSFLSLAIPALIYIITAFFKKSQVAQILRWISATLCIIILIIALYFLLRISFPI